MCVINVIIYGTFGNACLCYIVSKESITSLFTWLFREGSIVLINYASKIFYLKVFLRTIDNKDHWSSLLKCSWRCLVHSEFLSIPLSSLSISFHLSIKSFIRIILALLVITTHGLWQFYQCITKAYHHWLLWIKIFIIENTKGRVQYRFYITCTISWINSYVHKGERTVHKLQR